MFEPADRIPARYIHFSKMGVAVNTLIAIENLVHARGEYIEMTILLGGGGAFANGKILEDSDEPGTVFVSG